MTRDTTEEQRPVLWQQVLIGLLLFGLYLAIDSLETPGRRAAADRHGRAIFHLEQSLHLDVEHVLNNWLAPHAVLSTLANYEYAWTYILSALALLTWTYVRRPDLWRMTRDSFVVMNLIAFLGFWLYPTTPPRLLPELGFVDTVTRGATFGSWGNSLVDSANQLAAMPSLHVGWALWVSVILARITARRSVQVVSAVHVVLTAFVIMATANHYLLDGVAVVIPIWIGVKVASWAHETPGSVVPSCDAFFLHVESTGAAQHAAGLVVLEPSDNRPTIEEARELVRDGLATRPQMRQRLAPASRWRRPRWVQVDEVDLDWHVTEVRSDDGMAGLRRIVGELAESPMPRDRPLWRVVLVRDIGPAGRSALLFVVHHAVADGIGVILQSFSLFQPTVDLEMPDARRPGLVRRAAAVVVGLAQLATDGGAGRLPQGSSHRAYDLAEADLELVKRTAAARGVRITDLVIALVADALQAAAPGLAEAAGGEMRFSVPIMVRTPDTAEGNATAAIIVDVPVDGRPFDQLLAEVARRSGRLRRPTRAIASRFVMATGLRLLPEPYAGWFARTVYGSRFFHVVASNIPGPVPQLSLCGVPVHHTYPVLPVAPGTPLSMGALSWSGTLAFGAATDPQLLDASALTGHIAAALLRLQAEVAGVSGARSEQRPGLVPGQGFGQGPGHGSGQGSGQGPFEGEEEARA
ncbi:MAG TPA: phosphatase PAP2 family protein [Marmoricola sp.]|nr:phosphatase PAP2 family protein [Marmoricola sp.]